MDFNGFTLEISEVSLLSFNRPKANIFSTAVLNDFVRALEMLAQAKSVSVLVITGTGNTFMAGGDISEMANFGEREAAAFSTLFHRAMDLVEKFPCPVIAGVNGFALGGGCELVLACDLAIASEVAVFGSPEINIGVIPGAGGTKRLTERIGKLRAKELVFSGRKVYANEAFAIGLINKVVSKDSFQSEVMNMAKTLASKPIQCLKAAKELINTTSHEHEIKLFSRMFTYEDQKALMNKFLEKK